MKLPNGYGSIVKLSGKRRNPWMVRITSGKVYDDIKKTFKYERFVLGCYPTKQLANKALVDYNESPFELKDNSITFGEIYAIWSNKNYSELSKSSIESRNSALKYCTPIINRKIREINHSMLQEIIDDCPHGSSTKKNIKTVMNSVYDYSCKNNLTNKNYADFIKIENSEPTFERNIFTEKEIEILWSMSDKWDYKVLLILLYTGMRVNEFLKNNIENINLNEKWIYIPKEIAKNNPSIRYVPIHDKIFELVKWFYDNSILHEKKELVLNEKGTVIVYNNFVDRNLKKINKTMEYEHRFHDTRHTFATLGHKFNMDELSLKKILGHSPDNITQKVYTHITIAELRSEINKIKI